MLDNSEIRFLPLGARRVAYELRGDGPPLVAPAWWVSHLELDWQNADFRRFWEGVADGYALIRYDRLGVGMSDRTVHESDLTIDEEVATLRALLDELGIQRVTLVGGSCGSCTAIAFAAAYPERVERLVVYGSYRDGTEVTPPGVGDAIIGAVRVHWGLGARMLSDIFLGAAWQGRGLGREAVAVLVRHLIETRGHHRLTIDPLVTNALAIRCYQAAGFAPVGVMRQYERDDDGVWHDGLLMELLADDWRVREPDSS